MRLTTITNWAYGATVALTLISGGAMLVAVRAQEQERAAVDLRFELDQQTSMLDEDAASLSGLARRYVVSADPADLLAYERELRELGAVEARTRGLRDSGAESGELRSLHEALRWADTLQEQQKAALSAVQAGDRASAQRLLFSPEYERELDRILSSVRAFQDRLDQRTALTVREATSRAKAWQGLSQAMIAVTGGLFLFVLLFVFRNRVLRPVVRLSDVVKRLAANDYDAVPPDLAQVDEIGDMAEALRIFRANGIERRRLEQERDADLIVRDHLSRMTQRMQTCDTVGELEAVVSRFLPTIAPGVGGALYLLDPRRNALVQATHWGEPAHAAREFAPLSCWALRRGAPHRPAGDGIDMPCAHLGVDGGDPPDSACLPLAGQNGPLGLLYLEATGDGGRAALQDAYWRMLAENVGLALDNLRLREALRDMAMADALTTLANRRQLDSVLEGELARSARTGQPISCIMADVDHFKRFNDEVGHDAGDAVLQAVGQVLKEAMRDGQLAFRYGGEEFLMLLPGVTADEARDRAEQVRAAVAALRVRHGGRELGPITISLGVATAPVHCDREQLVVTADAALLRAKRGGRDRVSVANGRLPLSSNG